MKYKLTIPVLACLLTSYSVKSEMDLVLTNSTIVSPINKHQAETKPNHWIAIKDEVIVAIGADTPPPESKQVIDAKGKFVIPGLMDSHTHLKTMPGLAWSDKNSAHMQNAYLQRQGINYLYYGVTQVIDPSNTKQGIAMFESRGLTPDAFFCGAMPIFNGYNARGIPLKKLHTKRPYYVGQDKDPVTDKKIRNAHTIERSLQRLAEDGGICAKVYVEDGFGFANHIPVLTPEKLKELTQRATSLNLPVMAHANATDMQDMAVHSDVDILGHGLWNWLDEERAETREELSEKLPPKVTAILAEITKRDIAYQPTTNVTRSLRDLMVKESIKQAQYSSVLPKWQIDWYLSDAGQWFAKEMHRDWRGASVQQIIRAFDIKLNNGLRVAKYLYDAGATILLGSDTPPSPTFASQPGLTTYVELQSLNQAGIDLEGILAAATLNNAKAYNLSKLYGTVEVGKVANLLLLDSDPLSSVEAYNNIDAVILRGQSIKRHKLHIDELEQGSP